MENEKLTPDELENKLKKEWLRSPEELEKMQFFNKYIYYPYIEIGSRHASLVVNGPEVGISVKIQDIAEETTKMLESLVLKKTIMSFFIEFDPGESSDVTEDGGWKIIYETEKFGKMTNFLDLYILTK